mgnify:FL=1
MKNKNLNYFVTNGLKLAKSLILVAFLFMISLNKSFAECNFDGLQIGDSEDNAEGTYGTASEENFIWVIHVPSEEGCPGQNLEDVNVEIIIADGQIIGFRFNRNNVLLTENNNQSDLYKYVANNYGNIQGAEDPKWRGYKIFRRPDKEIIYNKMVYLKTLREELLVMDPKFKDVFIDHDYDIGNSPDDEE